MRQLILLIRLAAERSRTWSAVGNGSPGWSGIHHPRSGL